jgi:RNA polymerase sigma-70 factor, ECF subfamily
MPDWQEIVEREKRAVWQTAYRILGNRADADECFQRSSFESSPTRRAASLRNPSRDRVFSIMEPE